MPPAPSEGDVAAGVAAAVTVLETSGATILDLLQHEAASALTDDQLLAAVSHMLKAGADISESCQVGIPAGVAGTHEVAILAQRVATRTLAHLLKQKPASAARLKDIETLRAGVRSNKEYTLLFLVARGSDFRPHLEQLTQEAIIMGASKALPWLLQWQENTEEHLLEHLEGALAHVSPVVPPASASGAPQDAVPHSDLSGLAECIEVLVGHGLDTDGTTITCRLSALSPGVKSILTAAAETDGDSHEVNEGENTIEVPILDWAVLHTAATTAPPNGSESSPAGSDARATTPRASEADAGEEGGAGSSTTALVKAVLAGGAAAGAHGSTALLLAAQQLRPDLVAVLADAGADVSSARMPPSGKPLLEWAADESSCPPSSGVPAALQAAAARAAAAVQDAGSAPPSPAIHASSSAAGAAVGTGSGVSAGGASAKRPGAMVVEARGGAGAGLGAGGVVRTAPATIAGGSHQRYPSPSSVVRAGAGTSSVPTSSTSAAAAAAVASRPGVVTGSGRFPQLSGGGAGAGNGGPAAVPVSENHPSTNVVHQPAARPSEILAAQRAQRAAAAAAAAAGGGVPAGTAGTTTAPLSPRLPFTGGSSSSFAGAASSRSPSAAAAAAAAAKDSSSSSPAATQGAPASKQGTPSAPKGAPAEESNAGASTTPAVAAAGSNDSSQSNKGAKESGTPPPACNSKEQQAQELSPAAGAVSNTTAEDGTNKQEDSKQQEATEAVASASQTQADTQEATAGEEPSSSPEPTSDAPADSTGANTSGPAAASNADGTSSKKPKKKAKKKSKSKDRGPKVVVIGEPPKDRGSLLPSTLLEELQRDSQFIEAVYRNDVDAARELLEAGADVHHKSDKALLLAMGAIDPDAPDKWMPRPRDRAPVLSIGRPMVDLLLSHGADVNARNGRAACQAARWKDSYSLQYILSLPGADASNLLADPAVADWVATLSIPQIQAVAAAAKSAPLS